MNYDKNSFLAGVSVGRTLKGWATAGEGNGGAGGSGSWDKNDPTEIYNHTKPDDWCELPTPGVGEAYFILNVPDGGNGIVGITAMNSDYDAPVVDIGIVNNGVFTSNVTVSGRAEQKSITVNSSDYPGANKTSDGMVQIVFYVHGPGDARLMSLEFYYDKGESQYPDYNVPVIVCNMPYFSSFGCVGDVNYIYYYNMPKTMYVGITYGEDILLNTTYRYYRLIRDYKGKGEPMVHVVNRKVSYGS